MRTTRTHTVAPLPTGHDSQTLTNKTCSAGPEPTVKKVAPKIFKIPQEIQNNMGEKATQIKAASTKAKNAKAVNKSTKAWVAAGEWETLSGTRRAVGFTC